MKRGHVRRTDLMNFIKGHMRTNELIDDERKKRLSRLSVKESLREYEDLCEFWEKTSFKEASEDLDRQRISFLIKRRELLNRAGSVKK